MTSRLVLIAIDGSEQAENAFKFYANNLHREQNKVELIHHAEKPTITSPLYMDNLHQKDNHLLLIHSAEPPAVPSQHAMYMSAELWAEMLESEKVKVKKLEEHFAQMMREHHVSGKIKAIFGSRPGETIITEAKDNNASLIVMGTRGLGTVRRTILGSVSDYVLHHAHCPVVICRE